MDIPETDFQKKVTQSFSQQAFMKHIGAEIFFVEKGKCHIKIPYRSELTQQNGFLHAGVLGTIADNAAGYAAFSQMGENSSVLTAEFKINLLAPGIGDYFIARAEVVKQGRTLTLCRSDVYAVIGKKEKLCAAAQCTIMELKNETT